MNEERDARAEMTQEAAAQAQSQGMEVLEELLDRLQMSPEQAAKLLYQVVERSTAQRRKAEQVLEACAPTRPPWRRWKGGRT